MTVLRAKRHLSTQMARQGNQQTRAECRSGSGSLIRADRLRTATPQRHQHPPNGQRRGTGGGGLPPPAGRALQQSRGPLAYTGTPGDPACSAVRSARRAFLSASASPPRSTNTRGRQTLVYGSTTIAWRASWAAPPPTRSSSTTCRCTLRTRLRHGSSTCRPVRCTTGMTWFARSWGTSKARACAPGNLGTCGRAPRSPASRSGTSYDASPSAALSSRA
jgi:hypothetical protein